ncbi:MAG: nucleotidyltransferase domain-containing protein [Bdellovibrio sp.]
MRLTEKEKRALTNAVHSVLMGKYELYLFGSRTDLKKRGGDIDLLIVIEGSAKQAAMENKIKIKQVIFSLIPEQRIDITFATPEELKQDAFLKSIFPEAELLSERR